MTEIPTQAKLDKKWQVLCTPSELLVPCPGTPLPIGSKVQCGEPLLSEGAQCPSPASGQITAITDHHLIGGKPAQTVVLQTDPGAAPLPYEDSTLPMVKDAIAALQRDPASVQAHLAQGGIWADRWTCPDLTAQAKQAAARRIDVVLGSALDLDPVLLVDQQLALDYPNELAAGVAALGKLLGSRQSLLAVAEDIAAPGPALLRAAAQVTGIRLFPVRNEYPRGNPSLLIRHILGRRLAPGLSPTEAGVMLIDAPAAVALGRWITKRHPMTQTPLGIYDRHQHRAHLLSVPVGMRLGEVLTQAQIDFRLRDMRASQVLRDIAADAGQIVGSGETCIFLSDRHPHHEAAACLRCGWCVEACPARIHPAGLLEAAQQRDDRLAARYGVRSCIDCGICSYVCPARLPLLNSIRYLREVAMGRMRDN